VNPDFNVSALRTIHPPFKHCVALNFLSDEQKICFSGDTAYMPSLASFAENAKILVHEAMLQSGVDFVTAKTGNTDEGLYRHLIASHSFAHEAGRIAHDAGVELLVLSHLNTGGTYYCES
jgi:ribonuclease BN (tRNA processing enzyme)